MLLTVQVLWSASIFLTDDEVLRRTGKSVNVQEIVERPRLYIFARSQDSILEKLTYIETRAEDVLELKWPIKSPKGQTIHDHLRFFKGDHPEIQFEAGNSQGGTFPCLCGLSKGHFNDLESVFRSSLVGMETRHKTHCWLPCCESLGKSIHGASSPIQP